MNKLLLLKAREVPQCEVLFKKNKQRAGEGKFHVTSKKQNNYVLEIIINKYS